MPIINTTACKYSHWHKRNYEGYPTNSFHNKEIVGQLWAVVTKVSPVPNDAELLLNYAALEERGFRMLCGNKQCINLSHIRVYPERTHTPMLEKLIKLYTCSMAFDVRSPMPHLVGPPGCGKSSSVEQLAELLGVNLHIVNVSRLSPLELEGVQMPHGSGDDMVLRMLPATFWTSLKEGDILLMDEFLRGFPEVYNGLLDIFTSRRVGAFYLPKVFIIGASNSVTAYDSALEDRLLHIPVTDPRKSVAERTHLAEILVEQTGMHPSMVNSQEMKDLFDDEVLPMFGILDQFKRTGVKVGAALNVEGVSLRKLIGQTQMRMVTSNGLLNLLLANNGHALQANAPQYVVLPTGEAKYVPVKYAALAAKLVGNQGLTTIQATNLDINLQLMEMEAALREDDTP